MNHAALFSNQNKDFPQITERGDSNSSAPIPKTGQRTCSSSPHHSKNGLMHIILQGSPENRLSLIHTDGLAEIFYAGCHYWQHCILSGLGTGTGDPDAYAKGLAHTGWSHFGLGLALGIEPCVSLMLNQLNYPAAKEKLNADYMRK